MAHAPDYGESFADVYDRWYGDVTDAEATAERVAALAAAVVGATTADGRPRVVELGVGGGRLALPLARRGLDVTGIDASPAMLALLAARPDAHLVRAVEGDMADVDRLVDAPVAVVLVGFNTFFNLVTEADQRRCLAGVARVLAPGGSLLVEAFVPGDPPPSTERALATSRVELDRVVLTATEHDPVTQVVTGQHVDLADGGATVRLRPWRIRYATPAQLDEMAATAGLALAERHADWVGTPFTDDDAHHVTRYVAPASG